MSDTGARSGLDSVFADVLADLANRSLDLDPASRARLAALDGRRVQLSAALPPPFGRRDFTLQVSGGRLRLLPHAAVDPHVIVRGSVPDLLAWLLGGENAARGRLDIDGDSTVLAELRAALKAFRPELGEPLRRLLGDELTQSALGAAELALATLRSAFEGVQQSVRDGAAHAFVDRRECERFLDELDELRLRVDRLAARVQTEEQRRAAK